MMLNECKEVCGSHITKGLVSYVKEFELDPEGK